MSEMKFIKKLFKPDVLRRAAYNDNSLEAAFILMKGLLIFHQNHNNNSLFKFKRYNQDSFKTALARIFVSPFIALTLAVLFTFNAISFFLSGIWSLFKGNFNKAFDDIIIQTTGSIIGIFYSLTLIIGAPLLNLAQFVVRGVHTLKEIFSQKEANNQENATPIHRRTNSISKDTNDSQPGLGSNSRPLDFFEKPIHQKTTKFDDSSLTNKDIVSEAPRYGQ